MIVWETSGLKKGSFSMENLEFLVGWNDRIRDGKNEDTIEKTKKDRIKQSPHQTIVQHWNSRFLKCSEEVSLVNIYYTTCFPWGWE